MAKNKYSGGDYSFKSRYERRAPVYKTKKSNKGILAMVAAGAIIVVFAGYLMFTLVQYFANRPPAVEEKTTAPTAASGNTEDKTTTAPSKKTGDSSASSSIKAAYLDEATLKNETKLNSFIERAKELEVNAVVFDLKRPDGTLSYDSALEQTAAIGAVKDPIASVKDIISKLKENGITSIPRVYCFKDPLASGAIRPAAVHYGSSDTMLWLDASKANGGKSWLNPYSEEARTYLINIIKEVSGLGVGNIMLEAVQFPNRYTTNKANFGANANSISRTEILSQFVTEAQQAVNGGKVKLIVSVPGDAALNGNDMVYGGNAVDISGSICAPSLLVSDFSGSVPIGGTVIQNTQANQEEFLTAAGTAMKGYSADVTYMPWIEYSSQDVLKKQANALKQAGITQYIIYNSNGSY